MSLKEKAANKLQSAKGKAKEAVGKATNDKSLMRHGQVDQVKATVKDSVVKAKDIFNNAKKAAEDK